MIIDAVENLAVSDPDRHTNALRSLDYLWSGLEYLNGQVQQIENLVTSGVPHDRKMVMIGNAPRLRQVPQGLVACAFHWYATSVCNYVRLVGWLGLDQNPRRADAYVGRVIPNVRVWRNKVGAHFAMTNPRPEDTAAVLEASVMFPVGFEDRVFVTQPFTLALRRGGTSSSSREDMKWSLTQTHQALRSRYRVKPN